MNAIVALIVIGAVGLIFGRYLLLKPRPGSLMERFFLSGAEFLILGAIIGPSGLRILDRDTLVHVEPFLILALSWVGLLVGLQLRWNHLIRFPWSYFQVAILQSLVALSITMAVLGALFSFWTPVAAVAADRWRAAFCLAAVAALSSPTETMLHEHRAAHGGHSAGLLRFVPAVDPILSLVGVAILFAIWHAGDAALVYPLGAAGWLLVSGFVGIVLGALFLLLLWAASESDEVVLVVLGMALFSGGLATVFQLSPLVVCLVVGIVLGNWGHVQERLMQMFMRFERPLYVALLVLAGAAWRFDQPWGYVIALLFIGLRIAGKYLGVTLALNVTPLPFRPAGRWWLGLLPQGAMAIAIAVSYVVIYRDDLAQTVFAAVLVSTVILTFLSRNLVESALSGPAEDRSP